MPYVGPAPNPGQNREVDDISSSFNGSTTSFTLQVNSQNVSPGSPNNIIVSLGGVVQNPSTDYNIAASTITFTTAPASGLSFFGVVLGQQVDIQSLADGTSPTMSAPSITGDLSIADKIVHTGDTNTAIRFPAADTVTAETGGVERLRINSTGQTIVGDSVAQLSTSSERPFQVHSINGPKIAIGRNDTSISTGNTIGGLEFYGNDANGTFVNTATIVVNADGTHGDNDKPTRMEFLTTSDNASSASEKLRIDSNGFCRQPLKYHLVVQRSGNLTGYDAAGSFGTGLAYNSIASEFKDSALSSAFNTSNGLFTVPVDGIYFLEASAYAPGVPFSQGWFVINGSRSAYSDWVKGSTGTIVNCNNMVKLSTGNTVGYHPHAGGGNNSITINADANHTWMRITFIG